MSAFKGWNLAGLKAAVAIAGPASAGDLARMPEEVGHGPSRLGVIAHVAALREGGEWLDALPGSEVASGTGTYLQWLDCRGLGLGDDPAQVFLDRGRVR